MGSLYSNEDALWLPAAGIKKGQISWSSNWQSEASLKKNIKTPGVDKPFDKARIIGGRKKNHKKGFKSSNSEDV